MKKYIPLLLFFIAGCSGAGKKTPVQMTGAYHMLSQSVKSATVDTTYKTRLQMKIYTDDFFMYANTDAKDSSSSFGLGTYKTSADTVTEEVIYSASDSTFNEMGRIYKLLIEKTDKGYKQRIDQMSINDQHVTLFEEYEKAGTEVTTPLDGIWKQTAVKNIIGADTITNHITQYKAYFKGIVLWGQTFKNSEKKSYSAIGFGKFEMTGNNKVTENMEASSFYQVRGNKFDIDIQMNGPDEFTQTITNKDGSKSIETYQRLKK